MSIILALRRVMPAQVYSTDYTVDSGDDMEPEEQPRQTIINLCASLADLPTWSNAAEQAIEEFSLNLKQWQVVYSIACQLSGALSRIHEPLLLYCG